MKLKFFLVLLIISFCLSAFSFPILAKEPASIPQGSVLGVCDSFFGFLCNILPFLRPAPEVLTQCADNFKDLRSSVDVLDKNRNLKADGDKKTAKVNCDLEADLNLHLSGNLTHAIHIPKSANPVGQKVCTDSYANYGNENPKIGLDVLHNWLSLFGASSLTPPEVARGSGEGTGIMYMSRAQNDAQLQQKRLDNATPQYIRDGDLGDPASRLEPFDMDPHPLIFKTQTQIDKEHVVLGILRGYASSLYRLTSKGSIPKCSDVEISVFPDFKKFCGPGAFSDHAAGYLVAPPGVSCSVLSPNTEGHVTATAPTDGTCYRPLMASEFVFTNQELQDANGGLTRAVIDTIGQQVMGPEYSQGHIFSSSLFGRTFADAAKLILPSRTSSLSCGSLLCHDQAWQFVPRYVSSPEIPVKVHQKIVKGEQDASQHDSEGQSFEDRIKDISLAWIGGVADASVSVADSLTSYQTISQKKSQSSELKNVIITDFAFNDPQTVDAIGGNEIKSEGYQMCDTIDGTKWNDLVSKSAGPEPITDEFGNITGYKEQIINYPISREVSVDLTLPSDPYARIFRDIASGQSGFGNTMIPYALVSEMTKETDKGVPLNQTPMSLNNLECKDSSSCNDKVSLPAMGGVMLYLNTSPTSPLGMAPASTLSFTDISRSFPKQASTLVHDIAQKREQEEVAKAPWKLLSSFQTKKSINEDLSQKK